MGFIHKTHNKYCKQEFSFAFSNRYAVLVSSTLSGMDLCPLLVSGLFLPVFVTSKILVNKVGALTKSSMQQINQRFSQTLSYSMNCYKQPE